MTISIRSAVRPVAATLCLLAAISGYDRAIAESSEIPKTNAEIVKEVSQKFEETGIKVGMPKAKVMEILGDKFSVNKESLLRPGEEVLTWERADKSTITVTFSAETVRAVSYTVNNED